MAVIGYLLIAIGVILALAGGIGIIIAAFKESLIWGLGCLVVPAVSLIFVVLHWEDTKKPFFLNLAGVAALFLGGMCLPNHH